MDFCDLIRFLVKHDVEFGTSYDEERNIDIMSLRIADYETHKDLITTGPFTVIRKEDAIVLTSPSH